MIHKEQEPGEGFVVNYTPKNGANGFNDDTRTVSKSYMQWKVNKTQKIKDRRGNIRWESKTTYECELLS